MAPKLEGYGTTLVDSHTLEVEVSKEQNLNDIFSRLSALGIEVLSMRNKVNRLEEIFMRLVDKSGANLHVERDFGSIGREEIRKRAVAQALQLLRQMADSHAVVA